MEEKSEIMVIPNKYKDTLDDLIDSSDIESPNHLDSSNRAKLIDKESHNAPKSKDNSLTFLEEDYLDENISIMLLEPALKFQDFPVHQHPNIVILSVKKERAQYGKGQ